MDSFTVEAFTLLTIGILAIGIRTYSRWSSVGFRAFKPDDYVMLVAGIVYSLETATAYSVGAWWHGLANNGMSTEHRESLIPGGEEWNLRVGGSKTQLVGWSLYTLLLWLLKFCMCGFYSRLTEGVDDMSTRVNIGYGALGVTYLATELSILLGCQPFHHNWQINPDPGNFCQPAISKIDLYVTVVLNVVTDMYLMSIPLPILWRARLPLRRKILLLCMFGGGVFIMMAGILRCVLILRDPIGGAQQAGSWAVRETFVAVIIGNLPMIYPMFRRATRGLFESLGIGGTKDSSKDEPRPYIPSRDNRSGTGSGILGSSAIIKKFSGGRALYPMTTMAGTFTGSEERMVGTGTVSGDTGTAGSTQSGNSGSTSNPNSGKSDITVITETTVEDRERVDGEGKLQKRHWPLHS